jgi:hypothetical protein
MLCRITHRLPWVLTVTDDHVDDVIRCLRQWMVTEAWPIVASHHHARTAGATAAAALPGFQSQDGSCNLQSMQHTLGVPPQPSLLAAECLGCWPRQQPAGRAVGCWPLQEFQAGIRADVWAIGCSTLLDSTVCA